MAMWLVMFPGQKDTTADTWSMAHAEHDGEETMRFDPTQCHNVLRRYGRKHRGQLDGRGMAGDWFEAP